MHSDVHIKFRENCSSIQKLKGGTQRQRDDLINQLLTVRKDQNAHFVTNKSGMELTWILMVQAPTTKFSFMRNRAVLLYMKRS
jgi:hypothetical protein